MTLPYIVRILDRRTCQVIRRHDHVVVGYLRRRYEGSGPWAVTSHLAPGASEPDYRFVMRGTAAAEAWKRVPRESRPLY